MIIITCNIGEQAALLAKDALGFQKRDSNLAVISSAGYVLLNGISTQGHWTEQ